MLIKRWLVLTCCLALVPASNAFDKKESFNIAPLDRRLEAIKIDFLEEKELGEYPISLFVRTKETVSVPLDISVFYNEKQLNLTSLTSKTPYRRHPLRQWWKLPTNENSDAIRFEYILKKHGTDQVLDAGSIDLSASDRKHPPDAYELVVAEAEAGRYEVTVTTWTHQPREILGIIKRFLRFFNFNGKVSDKNLVPGSSEDPSVRHATSECEDGRPWRGLQVLQHMKRRYGEALAFPYWRAFAECALYGGLGAYANEIADTRFGAGDKNSLRYADIVLDIAGMAYRRAEFSQARDLLAGIKTRVPDPMQARWRDLMSRTYFATGQEDEAFMVLRQQEPLQDQNWAAPTERGRQLAYIRYNLAVAALRTGRIKEGRTLLDLLGTALDYHPGLRDQANLMLGWDLMKSGLGGSAREVLSRIPLQSHTAESALLVYGRATLAPVGHPPRRAKAIPGDSHYQELSPYRIKELYEQDKLSCQDFNRLTILPITACPTGNAYNGKTFAPDILDKNDERKERAIVIWEELMQRAPRSIYGIEAGLGSVLLLAELKKYSRALLKAKELKKNILDARASLYQVQEDIISGKIFDRLIDSSSEWRNDISTLGWKWEPRLSSAREEDGLYLRDWLSSPRTVALLQIVRDCRLLRPHLRLSHVKYPEATDDALRRIERAALLMLRAEATEILSKKNGMLHGYYISTLLTQTYLMDSSR